MDNTIEQLRDDDQYYNGIGQKYVSNSDISNLLYNPKDFKKPIEDNLNLVKGRVFHHLMLIDDAPNVDLIDASSRTTKIYKEALIEHDLKFAMLNKEYDEMVHLTKAMQGNMALSDIIYSADCKYEEPGITRIHDVDWKGKADIISSQPFTVEIETEDETKVFTYNDGAIIDLKTTSSLAKFSNSVSAFNYDSQAYIYRQLFGKEMVFIVIDKSDERMGIFPCEESVYERGERKVMRACKQWHKFYGPNKYADPEEFVLTQSLY